MLQLIVTSCTGISQSKQFERNLVSELQGYISVVLPQLNLTKIKFECLNMA